MFSKAAHNVLVPRDDPKTPTSTSVPSISNTQSSDSSAQPKRLTVGAGISLSGEITDCDRLVVQGDVRVRLYRVRTIEIAQTGRFTEGRAEVEEADIAGVYEGELAVRGRLLVRSTGRVTGTVHYGELELERGGRLAGSVGVREPLRGLGSDQIPGQVDGTTASAVEGPSAAVASSRPSSKPGPKRGQAIPAGNGVGHRQLPEAS